MPLVEGRCYVIAEAGSCHMGVKANAYRLVEAAAHAGADACKFQLFHLEDILIEPSLGDPRTELPGIWVPDLAACCREFRVDFLCTPFAPWAVRVLDRHVWAFKVGSFEHKRRDVLDAIRETGKPTIGSYGRGDPGTDYRLVCVSKYPTAYSDIGLPEFWNGTWDGFSDHTCSTVIPALAVARGAKIIEKHLRLPETTSDCPDYPHSLEPDRFREMVDHIRLAELTCWRTPQPQTLVQYPNRRE